MNSYQSTPSTSTGVVLGGTALGVLITIPMIIWSGFVLKVLWNWFIPSTFPGVPPLTIPQAIGLAIIVGLLTGRSSASSQSKGTNESGAWIAVKLFITIFGPLIMGAIVHAFM